MTRFLRYLRISFSATCIIVAVLLIVLWVRSYRWFDALQRKGEVTIAIQSADGQLLFYNDYDPYSIPPGSNGSYHLRSEIQNELPNDMIHDNFGELRPRQGIWGTRFVYDGPPFWHTGVPHWFALSVLVLVAALPWVRLRWRFSLRTLLIATTLVAVVLGIIVWMSRGNSFNQ